MKCQGLLMEEIRKKQLCAACLIFPSMLNVEIHLHCNYQSSSLEANRALSINIIIIIRKNV